MDNARACILKSLVSVENQLKILQPIIIVHMHHGLMHTHTHNQVNTYIVHVHV